MNNVFSFFRLFITNPEVFKKTKTKSKTVVLKDIKDRFKQLLSKYEVTFLVIVIMAILSQINWACHNTFNSFVIRMFTAIVGSAVFSILLLFFVSLSSFTKRLEYKSTKGLFIQLYDYFKYLFWISFVIIVGTQLNWALNHDFKDFWLRILLSLIASSAVTAIGVLLSGIYYNSLNIFNFNIRLSIKSFDKRFKYIFAGLLSVIILSQLNWIIKHSYENIVIRMAGAFVASWVITIVAGNIYLKIKSQNQTFLEYLQNLSIKPKYYLSLLFLTIYFHLASIYYYSGFNKTLSIIALLSLLPVQLFGILYFKRYFDKNRKLLPVIASIAILCFVTIQLLSFVVLILHKGFEISVFHIILKIGDKGLLAFVEAGIIVSLLTLPFYIIVEKIKLPILPKHYSVLYILSLLYFFGFIFLWNPLIIYSTSPDSFGFTAKAILSNNIGLFIIANIAALAVIFILPKKAKILPLILIITIVIIAFVNSSIIPLNMGTLQMHRFSDIHNLSSPNILLYFIESILIIAVIIFSIHILNNKYFKYTVTALLLLNAVIIIQANIVLNSHKKEKINNLKNKNIANINTDTNCNINFSKNKKNIVFLILDMFQGWYLRNIMEETPELKDFYDGFTWYPNTVSITNYTASSAPSMLAGFKYTPDILDKDTVHTLSEKVDFANIELANNVKNKGYKLISSSVPYSKVDTDVSDVFIPIWDMSWEIYKIPLKIGITKEFGYQVLWSNALFFCSPLFVKPKIYNKGSWLTKYKPKNENSDLTKHYNFLRVLPFISTNTSNNNNFILIWSKAPHFPWDIIDENGILEQNVVPYKNNKWCFEQTTAWIKWMKKNGVYDNTKIVILSDHGIRDAKNLSDVMIDNPYIPKEQNIVPLKELLNFTPLLMVKDFNSHGKLKEDWRFLSNVDAIDIALNDTNITTINNPPERKLFSFLVSWRIKAYKQNKYPIDKAYEIQKNVYEVKNWQRIK
jgi:hypothetical protein